MPRVKQFDASTYLTDWAAEVTAAINELDGLAVTHVNYPLQKAGNTAWAVLNMPVKWWGKLSAPTATGTANQWSYTATEQKKSTSGVAGWADRTGGKSVTAYNTIEVMAAASGANGNGVDPDNLTGTFAIQSAPAGVIVEITEVVVDDDGTTEYWFQYENGVDGACE